MGKNLAFKNKGNGHNIHYVSFNNLYTARILCLNGSIGNICNT